MAIKNTESYLRFKQEVVRQINLVVLISHAVPVLKRVLADQGASKTIALKPPDNFPHDKTDAPLLQKWAQDYSRVLAHVIVLSVFSQFEAYIRGALDEIYTRQGGPEAFVELAMKQAKQYWISAPKNVVEAKRKLRDSDKKNLAQKFRKYSRVLVQSGYSFPPDLLAVYGAKRLQEKLSSKGPKALRAWEIPDLLADALLLDVTPAEKDMYENLRNLRNAVAHGNQPSLTVHSAVTETGKLREWATKIDKHIAKHFLILAKYAR